MSSNINLIVFDMDGTLVDSSDTIYKATLKTFEKLKIPVNLPKSELDKRIGAHFRDIFSEVNIEVDDLEEFIEIYKSVYFDFINDSQLYDGMIELLEHLNDHKIKVALLTTKMQDQADKIIDHFNLRKYFSHVMGRRPGLNHKPSPDQLLFICRELNTDPSNALMVGDSEYDIQCGKNGGSYTCGVTYGYRSKDLLESENPDFMIDTPYELKTILEI